MTMGWSVPVAEPDAAPEQARCRLCDRWGPATGDREGVRNGPVRWRDPLPGQLFDAVPRCLDHEACWRRVVESGDTWPVADGRDPRPILPTISAPDGAASTVEASPSDAAAATVVEDVAAPAPVGSDTGAGSGDPIPPAADDPADELDWGFGA